jgi:hypothetical protein
MENELISQFISVASQRGQSGKFILIYMRNLLQGNCKKFQFQG